MTYYDILIVGAGHAGAQAAIGLRQAKFVGSLALLGDEPDPPYERPPLSKDYLAGEKEFERILIRPLDFWAAQDIALLLGRAITAVDAERHQVTLNDGSTIRYGRLIWATGGRPRRLACDGGNLIGVHAVRTRADVDQIIAELATATDVVVIGGGYIGLEAASVLSKLGRRVTVLEALPRVLARVAGEELSQFYELEHRAHGVDIRLGVTVDCIIGTGGKASGVRLGDGSVLPADMIVVGIGIIPAVEPLITAGASGTNGVDVDEYFQTSLPDIFAIGDCACHINAFSNGNRIRLESIQNANDQATMVVKALTGLPMPYRAIPWFWSTQYDLRLQTVGLSAGYDETVLRGSTALRSFSIIYLNQGRVIALDCVNATRDYAQGRSLVGAGIMAPSRALADVDIPLKHFVTQHEIGV